LPGGLSWSSINEKSWASAAEIAADEQALAGGISALDLSSALIKVGSFRHRMATGDHLVASHFLSDAAASSLEVRVANLERWLETEHSRKQEMPGQRRLALRFGLLMVALIYAASLPLVLPAIHEALEMLVR